MSNQRGTTLILVLCLAALLSLAGLGLLFVSDVDYRTAGNYIDRTRALDYTDSGLHEVLWRLNLKPVASPPPAGSLITVNSLTNYDARLNPDPLGLLSNGVDDDVDNPAKPDEPDELNLYYDWQARILLTPNLPSLGSPAVVADAIAATGPPWGSHVVAATVQPQATWRPYTVADAGSDDVMLIRYKLDLDTPQGDSEGDGPEIVFYDPRLTTNAAEDRNTLTSLGGNGNPADDSPYNITWSDGTTTYPASGSPVLIVEMVGRSVRGGRTVARRPVLAEVYQAQRAVMTKALCGCADLDLSGGGSTDSYRSSEGTYGTGPIYDNGDIGCNAGIKVGGGYEAHGNAEAGTNITFSGGNAKVWNDGSAGGYIEDDKFNVVGAVNENVLPVPQPCECTAVPVAAMVTKASVTNNNSNILPNNDNPYEYGTNTIETHSNIYNGGTNLKMSSDETIILPGGDYYFASIQLSGSASVQVGVDSDGDGLVDGPPTQKVRIFVSGNISMSGGGLMNNARPTDVEIYASGVGASIKFSGSSELRAMIYAPKSDIDLTGGAGFSGAALGRNVKNTGGGAVHFDEDLGTALMVLDGYKLLTWREQ